MTSMSARDRINMLFDSFEEFRGSPRDDDPLGFPDYSRALDEARSASGESEAVVIGVVQIGGRTAVAAVFEFGFLGGSMGRAVGDRLETAMERAAEQEVPFICVTSSGGARMQEGMAALAQMPRTVAASLDISRARIPRIVILGHPTTGGVYASFASLADVLIADDEATIGFAGPRVVEATTGGPLPSASHTARAALEAGLIDVALAPADQRAALSALLEVLGAPSPPPPPPGMPLRSVVNALPKGSQYRVAKSIADSEKGDAWAEYELARHPDRPAPRFYVSRLFNPVFELHGDRAGGDDPGVFAGLARFEGLPIAVAAFDRARPTASGFRKARRLVELAGRLEITLVTFVDTPGADPSFESEYDGLAAAIAGTFDSILSTPIPTVSAITGEGGSGGALALACADVIGIQQHAVFSVIAPEGAAEILYRDSARAPDVAADLRPTALDLIRLGLADDLIPEPEEGAHSDQEGAAGMIREWLSGALEKADEVGGRGRNRFRG